jgi:hypothetical protein
MTAQNCKFSLNGTGLITTTTFIPADTELTLYLGPDYCWTNYHFLLYNIHVLEHLLQPLALAEIPNNQQHNSILQCISGIQQSTTTLHFRDIQRLSPPTTIRHTTVIPPCPPDPIVSPTPALTELLPTLMTESDWLAQPTTSLLEQLRIIQHKRVIYTNDALSSADFAELFTSTWSAPLQCKLWHHINEHIDNTSFVAAPINIPTQPNPSRLLQTPIKYSFQSASMTFGFFFT